MSTDRKTAIIAGVLFIITEGAFATIGSVCLLLLLTLGQKFVKGGAPEASHFQTMGKLLLAGHDWD